jgi:hypothetical protein
MLELGCRKRDARYGASGMRFRDVHVICIMVDRWFLSATDEEVSLRKA